VTSHFLLMIVFSLCVAVVFAFLMKDDGREQLRFGAVVFGGFVLSALALGWLMFPF
jgi:ABC-type transport system involved in cytochrome c biogenesis permease component